MISDAELTNLWRAEQILHELARIIREGKVSEHDLVYNYLAVCECTEGVQALAARIQRERLENEGFDFSSSQGI